MDLFTIVPSALLTNPTKGEEKERKKNIEKHRKIKDK
jgi:hypothetical protein